MKKSNKSSAKHLSVAIATEFWVNLNGFIFEEDEYANYLDLDVPTLKFADELEYLDNVLSRCSKIPNRIVINGKDNQFTKITSDVMNIWRADSNLEKVEMWEGFTFDPNLYTAFWVDGDIYNSLPKTKLDAIYSDIKSEYIEQIVDFNNTEDDACTKIYRFDIFSYKTGEVIDSCELFFRKQFTSEFCFSIDCRLTKCI